MIKNEPFRFNFQVKDTIEREKSCGRRCIGINNGGIKVYTKADLGALLGESKHFG